MTETRPPVYFHIGAAKSGTTYLQSKLWFNRRQLRTDGICYPGERFPSHVWAALDLRGANFRGVVEPTVAGAWQRLVAEIRTSGLAGIIDQELFAAAGPKQVARAFEDLSFADVHIVLTLRDMARTLPAAWQERVKNREVDDFATFLAALREPPEQRSKTSREFWQLHDVPAILTKWTGRVSLDHVHVVTVPPPGSDPAILWNRFAEVLGIEPAGYRERSYPNSSLSAAEATVVRRLTVALGGSEFPWPVFNTVVKQNLAVELAKRPGQAIALPQADYEWAVDWCRSTAEFIRAQGYHVVGDLDELIPTGRKAGVDPDTVDVAEQADAAIDGMAALVRHIAAGGGKGLEARITKLQEELDQAREELRERKELPPGERVKRTLVELSGQVGWLGKAYDGYRKVRGRS